MSTQIFTFSNPSPNATPITPTKKKSKNSGGRPKSLVWRDNAIQGRKESEGHYEATCVYCDLFWKKGSPQELEAHFANDCSKVPADTRNFFLNHLAAKAEGNMTNLSSKKRKLNDGSIQTKMSEFHETCDGWTNSANESIWDFLIHTLNHKEYLWCLKDLSSESHTGEFLAKTIDEIIDEIGPANFSAIVSDSGANIRNARQIITEKYKNILNVRCMAHAINLISKDICSTSFANRILTKCSALKEEAKACGISGGGLKKWVNTRWHTMYDCVDSIMRHKVPLENLKCEKPKNLSTAVLSVLRSRAFFDDVRALAFTLRPIKQSIAALESQSCTLADCFLGLAKLGAAIKKLPNNDHRVFRQQCISIFNRRYAEFADPIYLLCFFLHPYYTEICWARGLFRDLLMIADEIFMKMGKNKAERKELMHQMKQYRIREKPFDIEMGDTETPYTWWFSIEDSFPKDEDYLVQLALKLFSVTPHAAGCERVWSSLGWIYGKRRTRLGLNKVENMYKLSAYYHANVKKELPYYGIEKSTEEIHQILIDAHLNPDQDLLELEDELLDYYNNEEEIVIGEEEELNIDNILDLDAFVDTLGDIIEDSIDSVEDEIQDNRVDVPMNENDDIEWDPAAEADEIINTM
ncbi:16073_t:CDS:2 [Rhizophagus irregularis]|nr:16073_t:CDS:2 [Rhizophagus irregularis]